MSNKNTKQEPPREPAELFLEKGMDEMLRYKNYELGYRLFKNYFLAVYGLSAVLAAVGGFLGDVPLAAAGILIVAISVILEIMYASKAASQGIMSPIFAKRIAVEMGAAHLVLPVFYTVMSVCGIIQAIDEGNFRFLPLSAVMFLISVTAYSEYFFARKNQKVLEKMLNDDNEDGEE
ncbi:MAG: hypothetical protein NC253_09715 [Ruminococcus sp.]|nr:hypothetical protein [Ruminococcus sp.]MCM1381499.1 hypothetical protein [Muribaculaceae bacterium]MCM1480348.1 hypothetical protein [Muribaculaceae bacterium]